MTKATQAINPDDFGHLQHQPITLSLNHFVLFVGT